MDKTLLHQCYHSKSVWKKCVYTTVHKFHWSVSSDSFLVLPGQTYNVTKVLPHPAVYRVQARNYIKSGKLLEVGKVKNLFIKTSETQGGNRLLYICTRRTYILTTYT